jgi:hypothetical protein
LAASFAPLARLTGGEYHDAASGTVAVEAIRTVVAREFADVESDRKVLTAWRSRNDWNLDELSEAIGVTPGRVAASLSRLGRRGFLRQPATRPGELTNPGCYPEPSDPPPGSDPSSPNSWRSVFGWIIGK